MGFVQVKNLNMTLLSVGYILHSAFEKKSPLKNPDKQVFTSREQKYLLSIVMVILVVFLKIYSYKLT